MQDSCAHYIGQRTNVTYGGDARNTLLLSAVNIARAGRQSLVQHAATATAGLRGDSNQ
jgi:hypothetical protein